MRVQTPRLLSASQLLPASARACARSTVSSAKGARGSFVADRLLTRSSRWEEPSEFAGEDTFYCPVGTGDPPVEVLLNCSSSAFVFELIPKLSITWLLRATVSAQSALCVNLRNRRAEVELGARVVFFALDGIGIDFFIVRVFRFRLYRKNVSDTVNAFYLNGRLVLHL